MIEIRARYIGGLSEPVSVRIYGMVDGDRDVGGWFMYKPLDDPQGKMRTEEFTEFDNLHRCFVPRRSKQNQPDKVMP